MVNAEACPHCPWCHHALKGTPAGWECQRTYQHAGSAIYHRVFAVRNPREGDIIMSNSKFPITGSIWRHWRTGDDYRVLGPVYIEVDAVLSVAYRRADDEAAPTWVRPLSEWDEIVAADTRRFAEVGNGVT